ncbi:hypothetical protein HY041_02230, partial [Candidatus Roizmanbacteria bacterium]|nr:hypothetical protein [Candidatus Roizmanbacteria bacterium]
RIVELSEVRPHPKKRILLPRFRTITNLLRNKADVTAFFKEQKGSKLTKEEQEILEERIKYAKLYLENYAEEKTPDTGMKPPFALSDDQKLFLSELRNILVKLKNPSREELQNSIFTLFKEKNFKPKEVFQAFYQTLTGKDFGPKAPDIILDLGINKALYLLEEVLNKKELKTSQKKSQFLFHDLNDTNIFSISDEVAKQYPSITIGIAIIRGVAIKKSSKELNQRIQDFVSSQSHLTNQIIGSYPEIQSYRRIYKEMGIDWHSRRPSPEALLRRIALKKGLYQINTCVDAYNLVVMRNRISSGAFDLDKIQFPTLLRHPKQGEEILLIGDTEPTKYKPSELAYFDQIGGYNIDFNYRDSQRTAVTEKTKNLFINIDGIYDITRETVEKTLKDTVEEIIKYCGGKVEVAGISTAE